MRAVQKGAFSPGLSRAERVAQALAELPEKFQHLPETGPDDLPEKYPAEENVSEAGTDLSEAGAAAGGRTSRGRGGQAESQ